MSDQHNRRQAAEVLDEMTDDELSAWVEGGDFTSIRGIALSDDDATRIADALGAPEVAGFNFGLGFGSNLNPPSTPPLGGHVESRKAGHGQQDFLRITIKDVLISSF